MFKKRIHKNVTKFDQNSSKQRITLKDKITKSSISIDLKNKKNYQQEQLNVEEKFGVFQQDIYIKDYPSPELQITQSIIEDYIDVVRQDKDFYYLWNFFKDQKNQTKHQFRENLIENLKEFIKINQTGLYQKYYQNFLIHLQTLRSHNLIKERTAFELIQQLKNFNNQKKEEN